jgi:hypothetical protein
MVVIFKFGKNDRVSLALAVFRLSYMRAPFVASCQTQKAEKIVTGNQTSCVAREKKPILVKHLFSEHI